MSGYQLEETIIIHFTGGIFKKIAITDEFISIDVTRLKSHIVAMLSDSINLFESPVILLYSKYWAPRDNFRFI